MVLVFTNIQLSKMSNTLLRDNLLGIQDITLEQLNAEAASNENGYSCLMFPHRVFVSIKDDENYHYDLEWLVSTKPNQYNMGQVLETCVKSFIENRLKMNPTDSLIKEVKSYASFIDGFYPDFMIHCKAPGKIRSDCPCGEPIGWNGAVMWDDYVKITNWESEKRLIL